MKAGLIRRVWEEGMIAYVEGRLAEVFDSGCIVATDAGVGYEVALCAPALNALPARGEPVAFYTATVVREDALELFGFQTWDERRVFLILTSISKVGARTAMAVLSTFRPDDLRRVVLEDDYLALTRVSGIGKKSAQHIFLELKYKLEGKAAAAENVLGGGAPGGVAADALAALMNLGYAEEEAAKSIRGVLAAEPDIDVSGALRMALKQLGRSR